MRTDSRREHDLGDMGWSLQGGFDNDTTSHAVADQHGGRQGKCLHDFRNVSPVSLDGAFGHRTWACAMSTQIDGDCLVAR